MKPFNRKNLTIPCIVWKLGNKQWIASTFWEESNNGLVSTDYAASCCPSFPNVVTRGKTGTEAVKKILFTLNRCGFIGDFSSCDEYPNLKEKWFDLNDNKLLRI